MSLTIQQIILDAKRLASRLKEHDSAADNLISQAQSTFNQVDAMKQYKEEVAELNEAAGQKPHSVLVASIQQENRHLRELQQENRELRAALEEHQNAMELIMSKYRQQVAQLIESSKVPAGTFQNSNYSRVVCEQADKICEMAAVMEKAADIDEKRTLQEQELMSRLSTENKGLRDLLEISCKYGSLRHSLLGIEAEDKEIQTELNEPLS